MTVRGLPEGALFMRQFFDQRTFGPDRRVYLAAQLPVTPPDEQARRDKQVTKLRERLHQIDAAENAHARQIEALANLDPTATAVTALRSRTLARFTELETERAHIGKQLTDLAKDTAPHGEPTLLDNSMLTGPLQDTPVHWEVPVIM